MLKNKWVWGVVLTVLVGSASLVLAGNGLREEARRRAAQQVELPVPPHVYAMPTPMPPAVSAPPLPFPYPIRPRFSGPCRADPELFRYIAERRAVLREGATAQEGALGNAIATVNFRHPIPQAEADQLAVEYGLVLGSLWYVTNTDISGVCGECSLSQEEVRLRSEHGDQIAIEGVVAVEVIGPAEGLIQLDGRPEVLLVDLGTPKAIEELPGKYGAVYPDRLFYRYERACR